MKLSQENETVLIIEHNIEFISHVADYLVDLGRNAGNKGGETIIQGKPIEVVRNIESSWNNIINRFLVVDLYYIRIFFFPIL